MAVTRESRPLAHLLGVRASGVSVDGGGVVVVQDNQAQHLEHKDLHSVRIHHRGVWAHVEFKSSDGRSLIARGLRLSDARTVATCTNLWHLKDQVETLVREFDLDHNRPRYMTRGMYERWLAGLTSVSALLRATLDGPALPQELVARAVYLRSLRDLGVDALASRNSLYVEEQARRHAAFFRDGQGYSLNARQIEAVLHDEGRCLVVAGAGTGKTSAIVAKTLHILTEQLARPDEVLLLAFTNKACDEMKARIMQLSSTPVTVNTFHKLGTDAIATATGKAPTHSRWSNDERSMRRAVQGFLEDLVNTQSGDGSIASFLAYHRYPVRPEHSFASPLEYNRALVAQDIRSLRDEKLKSLEECMIANWLALNGIDYQYERRYEHDTASIQYRQYLPDFYLPRYGIYIEHFGINSKGEPPPFFRNPDAYLDGMRWKRALHRDRGTTLVETFSHQASAGILLSELDASLRALGVQPSPIGPTELQALLCNETTISPLASLMCTFLRHFKEGGWTFDEIRTKHSPNSDARANCFLAIAEAVLSRYEEALREECAIDFSDMIKQATELAESGRFQSRYRYILVDEFQDISRGRARLLQALLAQVQDARLFCVGDDWQSIYRFTGSDISLMTSFPDHFGFTRRTDFDSTHRFGNRLLDASSRFVSANPGQLQKQLVASREDEEPAIEIISVASKQEQREGLAEAFDRICEDCNGEATSVLVVGRYRHCLRDLRAVRPPHAGISPHFLTVHKAKGLEADYCIILDVVRGRYGFPTEIADDPLLDLVLAHKGTGTNAEERRLFYVAMTRAKRKCFILTRDTDRSVFIDELESDGYRGLVLPSEGAARIIPCPECLGGFMLPRQSKSGAFWGCSSYPRCRCIAKLCPWCGEGALVRRESHYECSSAECGHKADICPQCDTGALVPRDGQYGQFLGCTEWRSSGASCDYTRSI